MKQFQNLNNLMEFINLLITRMIKKMGRFTIACLHSKLIIVFTLLAIFGCRKDDDALNEDDSSINIKEILYCLPESNQSDIQPKFAIKTTNQTLLTYEYTGEKKDSLSCIFYYDNTENQGRCLVFSQNKMTQYTLSSQNEFSNYVFEAEILDSLICFREFEYNWNNYNITFLGEYYFEKSDSYVQLKSNKSENNEPEEKFALDFVKSTIDKSAEVYKSAGKVNEAIGDPRGKLNGRAFNSISELIKRGKEIIDDGNENDENFWTTPVHEFVPEWFEDLNITITNKKDEYWEKTGEYLTGMKDGAISICKVLYGVYLEESIMKVREYFSDFKLSTYKMAFHKEGGSNSFTINTELTITKISSTKNWCTVSYSPDNPSTVLVSVFTNGTNKTRIATIFVDAIDKSSGKTRSKAVCIIQDNTEPGILGEWMCNTTGSPENDAFQVTLKENGIAVISGVTGTWRLNNNAIVIKFSGQDNASYTLNGTVNDAKTQISGNYVDVWAIYDEENGNYFLYNETYYGTFIMSLLVSEWL